MMSELSKLARDTANRNRAARWPEDLDSAEDILEELADEIERLQAIVDKLPKTKDGVSVVPKVDKVHHPRYAYPGIVIGSYAGWMHNIESISDCYSSREAAEKAREQ